MTMTGNWMIEFRGESRANMYPMGQTVVHTTSSYQEILIAETLPYGKALFLDGVPQSSAADEHVYHETLVHPAMVACPEPRSVFIAGGGEGAILREILKHQSVERVLMVDIDGELIALVKEHLPEWHQGAFDDPRVELAHEDARAHLERTSERFDVIFGDLPDPVENSPASDLFTSEFFSLVRSRLNPGGTYALQAETTEINWCRSHGKILQNLRQSFNTVLPYQVTIPFYGLPWGFAVAGDHALEERLNATAVERILHERHLSDLAVYDAEAHLHMFSLPKYLREIYRNPDAAAKLRDSMDLDVR